jgi:hypothetical protein
MAPLRESDGPEEAGMRNDLDPLILDLLEWISREPRSYAEVIDAWRTSCPRLTVWEDAMDRGFAAREHSRGREVMIRLTATGRGFLREHGRVAGKAATGKTRTPSLRAKRSNPEAASKDWIASSPRSSQ